MNKVFVIVFLFLYSSLCAYAQVDDSKLDLSSPSNGKEEAAKYASLLQEYYKNGEYELHKIYSDSLLLISELYGITDMNILALNSQAIYYKNLLLSFLPLHFFVCTPLYAWHPPLEFLFLVISFLFLKR